MRHFHVLVALVAAIGGASLGHAQAKTAAECNAEYASNRAAILAAQKKADFIRACRAGNETISASGSATSASAPKASPASVPAAATVPTKAPPLAPAAPRPTAAASPTGAKEFALEGQAKAQCPTDTVVWVNKKSRVYHFAGNRSYGATKSGVYMCEAAAKGAGDRAALNEKHP